MQGLRYRLPLPQVCRPFGAYNPHNLIPNSRSDGGGTFISGRASCGIHHLPVFCRTYSALFCVVLYPRRCLGLTSYALCFPLRTANFVFSALFRLELTYNLLDAYHSPFCLYAKVKKGKYRPANRGQRAVRKTRCYGLFRLRYDSGLSLFQFFACATK